VIVTLTPNPALDLTYHLERLEVGASQRVPPAQVRAGGKGVNVARVLHDQGHPVRVVAPVGGRSGESFTADLDDAGVPHSLLPVAPATRSTVAIVTPESTTNLNEAGAPLADTDWDALLALTSAALTAGTGRPVLVCSGSLPAGAPADVMARVVAVARERGARCVVDTSGDHLLVAADAGADVLKPNHHELLAAVGGPDPVTAARTLARRSGGLVYASLGADGLLRVPAEGPVLRARLDSALSGNTTGAGDAAVAAIAGALALAETDDAAVLARATAWSAAAVLHPLAGGIADPDPLLHRITVEPWEDPCR